MLLRRYVEVEEEWWCTQWFYQAPHCGLMGIDPFRGCGRLCGGLLTFPSCQLSLLQVVLGSPKGRCVNLYIHSDVSFLIPIELLYLSLVTYGMGVSTEPSYQVHGRNQSCVGVYSILFHLIICQASHTFQYPELFLLIHHVTQAEVFL